MRDSLRTLRRTVVRGLVLADRAVAKLRPPPPPAPRRPAAEVLEELGQQVIVVTGSSGGLGLAVARAYAAQGAAVVLNGRDRESLGAAAASLGRTGARVAAVRADVTTPGGAATLIREAVEAFGRVDVLVNNAGISGPSNKAVWDVDPAEWEHVISTNLTAAFLCAREAIRWAQGSERRLRVINVSSGVVQRGAAELGPYAVSKSGLEGLTRALSVDADGGRGVVSAVSIRPRSVRTRMTHGYYGRAEYAQLDDPEDITDVFLYAACAPSDEVSGKCISEPVFAADPRGAVILNNHVAGFARALPEPDTFLPEALASDHSGAYMHLIQNPFGSYPGVEEALRERLQDPMLHQYPEPTYRELRGALAQRLGVDDQHIVLGTGSSELLDRTFRTFAGPPGTVIFTRPTWSFAWQLLQKYGFDLVKVPHRGGLAAKDYHPDLEGIHAAVTPDTRLIYLVNPCNPTGAAVDREQLADFATSLPAHVTLLLDEAYIEFADPERRFDLTSCVDAARCRVIGYRTFSKFFSLSGFRVGYAYGNPEGVEFISRLEVPFAIATASQAAALAALGDEESQQRTFENNRCERNRICAELDRMGIENMPSQANFVLFNAPLGWPELRRAAREQGIFMPNLDAVFNRNYGLTAVGLPEHNDRILEILARY